MPPPYNNPDWITFVATPHVHAGPVGYVPLTWASRHNLIHIPTSPTPLPNTNLTRAQVMQICRDPAYPVLFGYVCAMAWGLQGAQPGGYKHVTTAWRNSSRIAKILNTLRGGGLTRCQAYDLFIGNNTVPGLGPAYFTKLIYFFGSNVDGYIMDQWTAKSVNLLTGSCVVRMSGNAVYNRNKSGNYQAYCEEVDLIASQLTAIKNPPSKITGEQAEEMLMSKGGHNPWPWRAHVKTKWPTYSSANKYDRNIVQRIYPHIPPNCF